MAPSGYSVAWLNCLRQAWSVRFLWIKNLTVANPYLVLPHIKGLDFHAMLKVSYPVEKIASVTNVVPCRRVGNLAHHSCSKQYEEIFSSIRYYSSLYCLMLFRPGALQLTFAFTSMVALTQ